MKAYLIFIGLFITLFLLGCTEKRFIGGERDEYGCLGSAGYSYDKDVGACTRNWEIKEKSQKEAAKIAVDSIGFTKGLTVVNVELKECEGCYSVELQVEQGTMKVNIEDGKIVDDFNREETECTSDNDCVKGGCSGNICQSKNSEPIFTTCEYLPEYGCYSEISCGCINGKCEWQKTEEFNNCVEEARSSSGGVIV